MTQDRIGVLGLGGYVPERVMTNEEWTRYVDTSDDWITERTGIKTRHIAAEHESTADLAIAAARVALADAGLGADDVDEIIVASDTPEAYSPDTAAFVQHGLGAGNVPAYDLGSSGCAGSVLALDVGRGRVQDGRNVLVIGVEVITRLMDWHQRETAVLFGDGAGAVILGRGPNLPEIVAATSGTDGAQAGILGMTVGGTRIPFTVERAKQGEHQTVIMDGREVYRHAVARMTQASQEVLAMASVEVDQVALVVPHQANLRILDTVRKKLGVPEEKVYINVDRFGNTGSASVPLALWEARSTGRIQAGDLVLLTAFGAGFHWAAALIQF